MITIIILLCLTSMIKSITILPDNVMNGVVFQPFKQIRFQEGSTYLTYKLNMSIFKTILNKEHEINKRCPEEFLQFNKMRETWNSNWIETQYIKRNTDEHKIETEELSILKTYMQHFPIKGCSNLYKIESLFLEIEEQYREIKTLSFDIILKLINVERLMRDTKRKALELHINFTTPISFSKLFIKDFMSIVKPTYSFFENTIYITFEIPFFIQKDITLFTVHPKPFIHENEFYMIETNLKYAIVETYTQYLYTQKSYKNNCFKVSNIHYCKDNYLEQRSPCENEYILSDEKLFRKKTFNETCFTKLQKKNKITQIGKQLYFSIINPMNIYITHNKIDYIITLNSSAKIIEEIDYFLRTPFFQYNPIDESRYQIFEANEKEHKEIVFNFEVEHKSNTPLAIVLVITLIILSILISIILKTCISRNGNITLPNIAYKSKSHQRNLENI